MTKLTVLFVALIAAYANAECPNACSGHGTCALHDQCECCRNFGGADCSERICPFGNAHVDTPKGDVDGSTGTLSGPSTTLIVGSNVYPFGTTEQYPNLDVDEGHAYMECSNKGLCNREEGNCECFPGYDGTACQRASCPNDCSGHGTCETIKELAEDKEDGDLAEDSLTAIGMGDLSGVGNLKYELWDKTLTMGCKCDPGFTGPDCSLKLCRYGVDPLFIPSTHSYSPVLALEGDMLSPSAPHYEKAFVEIIAKDYGDTGGEDASKMSGNFDLVIYDVYGEKYVLDKLKYAHFDEIAAGLGGATGLHTYAAAPQAAGYTKIGFGSNHTTCAEIMAHFPNDKIKDTTMGSFQNQMKHRGGLVSSAYVSGTTKPFCSVTAPHGQNITGGGVQQKAANLDGTGTGAMTLTAVTDAHIKNVAVGDLITGDTTDAAGILANCGAICYVKSIAYAANANVITLWKAAEKEDPSNPQAFTLASAAGKFHVATLSGGYGTTYTAAGVMSGTFGIRYNFDYNRGNPGYHKDLYIENVIPEVGGGGGRSLKSDASADRPYVPVTAFYGVIQQGEVAEYKGDQAEDRPATSYDVTLPGYITDIASSCTNTAAACASGDTITFSTDLSSYLYGLYDHGTAAADWFMPDHKTNKIKIFNRYYMVATTKRILVTAKVAERSDYEIGEYDSPTNATLGRFVTQAKLIDDADPALVYAQYWKANGVGAGMLQTCACSIKADTTSATTTTADTAITLAASASGKDRATIREGMQVEAVTSKIAAGTLVQRGPNNAADCVVNFPKTGSKVYLSKALLGDVASTADLVFTDPSYESGGKGGCLGCAHNLPLPNEETANAASAGYIYNGRVDFSVPNAIFKSVENTQPSTGCGQFVQNCVNTGTQSYLDCASLEGIKVGQTVSGDVKIAVAGTELPKVVAISTVAVNDGAGTASKVYYRVTLDRITAAAVDDGTAGDHIAVTFKNTATTYAADCKNGFDSMVAGKLVSGTDGYTPDLKITVKAKLSQPYQYVSECSNRGACDRETGLCQCFVGYTHDNCDTQTPVC